MLIDRMDAEVLKENENATFINWGNFLIKKINRYYYRAVFINFVIIFTLFLITLLMFFI